VWLAYNLLGDTPSGLAAENVGVGSPFRGIEMLYTGVLNARDLLCWIVLIVRAAADDRTKQRRAALMDTPATIIAIPWRQLLPRTV
jgi:hypothetical protein